jgi:hypothetical protein
MPQTKLRLWWQNLKMWQKIRFLPFWRVKWSKETVLEPQVAGGKDLAKAVWDGRTGQMGFELPISQWSNFVRFKTG